MTLKHFHKHKKEKEDDILSKSIQSKTKINDELNNNKINNINNINILKKSSSGKNSFISRYDSNNRNNKTIHIDNKRDLLLNNKFFSTSDGTFEKVFAHKEVAATNVPITAPVFKPA